MMNENYLWDKTGDDAEIEKLENVLKVFRYRETAPPELPAKTIAFKPNASRRFFRFSMAFAACAAVLLVFTGIWFKFSTETIEVAKDSAKPIATRQIAESSKEVVDKKSDDSVIVETNEPAIIKVKNSPTTTKSKSFKTTEFADVKHRRKRTETKSVEPQLTAVKLTKEEKYAYDQLMLALSFTGSKLKIVKDKVEGIEDQTAVLEK